MIAAALADGSRRPRRRTFGRELRLSENGRLFVRRGTAEIGTKQPSNEATVNVRLRRIQTTTTCDARL